jgi:hypothetical protein
MKENCESCGYPVDDPLEEVVVNAYRRDKEHFERRICKICYSTFITNAIGSKDEELFATIGWIGNYIIDEIRKMKK